MLTSPIVELALALALNTTPPLMSLSPVWDKVDPAFNFVTQTRGTIIVCFCICLLSDLGGKSVFCLLLMLQPSPISCGHISSYLTGSHGGFSL